MVGYILRTSFLRLNRARGVIVAAPVLITTEAVSLGAAMLFMISREINKKLMLKVKKHKQLSTMAEKLRNKISDNISIVLNKEFSFVLSEVSTFLKIKNKLRAIPTSKDAL